MHTFLINNLNTGIVQWLSTWWAGQTWQEIIAVITGIGCVYLAARANILNWPLAIISVTLYIYIFYQAHLYADTGLQVFFLIMNIYGWYYWSHKPSDGAIQPVINIKRKEVIMSVAAVTVTTVFLGSALHYTAASYPYLDSFCAACSIVAQLLMARKVVQNWLIWVFVDVIYVGVYLYKDLHLTAIMYGIYLVLAAYGYIDWRKQYRAQVSAAKQ